VSENPTPSMRGGGGTLGGDYCTGADNPPNVGMAGGTSAVPGGSYPWLSSWPAGRLNGRGMESLRGPLRPAIGGIGLAHRTEAAAATVTRQTKPQIVNVTHLNGGTDRSASGASASRA
jgi:hypothetical protein